MPGGPLQFVQIEPTLVKRAGHCFDYSYDIGTEAVRRGHRYRVLLGRELPLPYVRELQAAGIEVVRRFRATEVNKLRARAAKWLAHTVEFGRSLRSELLRLPASSVVFTASGELDYIVGAAAALALVDDGPRCIFHMFRAARAPEKIEESLVLRGYLSLTRRLLARSNGAGLVISAQTGALAEPIFKYLGVSAAVLPSMVDWSRLLVEPSVSAEPVIAFLGPARQEKGFHHLVRLHSALGSTCRFVVQLTPDPDFATASFAATATRLRSDPRVVTYDRPLDRSEYAAALGRADIVMLPYDSAAYRDRTSGIFVEAIGLSKIVIAPAATWMGRELDRMGLYPGYRDESSDGILKHLCGAISRRAELGVQTAAVAPGWRREHSVESFVDGLLELAHKRL